MFPNNPIRGAQLYMACVQIRVAGAGGVPLPAGVGFPGAYEYFTPLLLLSSISISWGSDNSTVIQTPASTTM